MDVRDKSGVFVAGNCARTAGAAETIDGISTTGVQVQVPIIDAGTAAGTYYGPSELVVTDESGRVLASGTVAGEPAIKFTQRSLDGNHHFSSEVISGSSIKGYKFTPYKATSQQTTIVHTIDASLDDTTYMLKIRRMGSDNNKYKDPTVHTVKFKTAATGSTAAQIAAGLVADINANLNNDVIMPMSAVVGGAASDAVIITALPLDWELGKFKYSRLKFWVELVNFDATIVNNMFDDLTYNAITYNQATLGAGNYEQVIEQEFFAKAYTGANRDLLSPFYRRTVVPMDAEKFENDGTTLNRYDTVVINWVNSQGDWSMNVKQQGSVVLFLPLDNNTTNQQANIIATLNAYIVTDLGVGSAITLS